VPNDQFAAAVEAELKVESLKLKRVAQGVPPETSLLRAPALGAGKAYQNRWRWPRFWTL